MLDYRHEKTVSWISLITSSGTWICCALPILLTAIGFGSTVSALFQTFPLLQSVESRPEALIILSGLFLLVTFALLYRPGRSCPITPEKARQCESTLRWNKQALLVSALLWVSAMVAVYLL